jgi:hypothetical protein
VEKSGWPIGHAARAKHSLASEARPHNFNTIPKKKFRFSQVRYKIDIVGNNGFDLASLSKFERFRFLSTTGMLIDFLISQLGDDEIRAFGIIHRNDDGTKAPIKFLGE